MNFQAIRLLTNQEAGRIVSELEQREFADGKYNLQLKQECRKHSDLDRQVFAAFQPSHAFQAFAIPKRVAAPIFSRYDPGNGARRTAHQTRTRAKRSSILLGSPPRDKRDPLRGRQLVAKAPPKARRSRS
jgi:predicted 2-oxoglutarate/Fe(II)-dependent dioxygenase YbiX